MCAVVEIQISGFALSQSQILSQLSKFKAHCDKNKAGYTISIVAYGGTCLCDPEPGFSDDLKALLSQLSGRFDSVIYSPNDYQFPEDKTISACLTPNDIVERYPPSLNTPPMRIKVLNT
jgi:hypothetical protein